MDEEVIKTGEAAPEQKQPTAAEYERMRQQYIKERKKEIEVLRLDVEFEELQIRHFEASKKIKQINDEAEAYAKAKKEKDSRDFAESLK